LPGRFYRHPSALPEVEQSSIRQDLHRRDFTINTLALRLTPDHFGELLDFYGGQNDLEARWSGCCSSACRGPPDAPPPG
jgi:tRNA nucleotidyltransferase (CCA-adding enzyme)